jgi:hypothetical protein
LATYVGDFCQPSFGEYIALRPESTTNDLFKEAQIFLQEEYIASKREKPSEAVPPTHPVLLIKEEETCPPSSQQRTSGITKDLIKQLEKPILESVTKVIEQDNQPVIGAINDFAVRVTILGKSMGCLQN